MASTTLPMFLAVIVASLCFAPGSLGLVSSQSWSGGYDLQNLMHFEYEAHATEPGNWELSAYANVDKNPVENPEGLVSNIKSAANAKDVDFAAVGVNLPGFGGCVGQKSYPCLIVTKDGNTVANSCLNLSAPCKNGN